MLEPSPSEHVVVSQWRLLDQATIDRFADVTGDHQFIHVDRERARQIGFGSTIAHGFLALSLVPHAEGMAAAADSDSPAPP